MITEADPCRDYILPKLYEAGRIKGSDCVVEVGDQDRSMEDADVVVVPGVFFPSARIRFTGPGDSNGPDVFAGAVLCWDAS